jgi:hypothetical protein
MFATLPTGLMVNGKLQSPSLARGLKEMQLNGFCEECQEKEPTQQLLNRVTQHLGNATTS